MQRPRLRMIFTIQARVHGIAGGYRVLVATYTMHIFEGVCTAFRIFHKASWIKPLLIWPTWCWSDHTMDTNEYTYLLNRSLYEHQTTNIYLILLFEYFWCDDNLSKRIGFWFRKGFICVRYKFSIDVQRVNWLALIRICGRTTYAS